MVVTDSGATGGDQGSLPVPLLEARGVTIRFGDLVANQDVDFSIYPGEIHAILGENGAGKSTILKSLFGVYHPQAGSFFKEGHPIRIHSPADARSLGMGMVFQDLRLVPAFTVLENIALANSRNASLDLGRLRGRITALAERYHLTVDPDVPVWQLDLAGRQRVEIVKVLLTGANIILLDEPTSVLALSEVDAFLAMLRRLRDEGHAIVMVTHKMREVLACAGRVTVMRAGRVVHTTNSLEGLNEDELVRLMIGDWAPTGITGRPAVTRAGEPVLRVDNLSVKDDKGRLILSEVNLTLEAGEIIGVAGISGNGQRELAEALLGLRPLSAGRIIAHDETLSGAPAAAFLNAGIASIPQNPREEGVVPGLTVLEHFAYDGLPRREHRMQVDWAALSADFAAAPAVDELNVPEPGRVAATLSGGNVQRMMVARALARRPRVMVASYPTQGLDIATTQRLMALLLGLRGHGCGVLLFSEDLSELYQVADVLVVVTHGRMLGPFDPVKIPAYDVAGLMVAGDGYRSNRLGHPLEVPA